MEEKEEPKGEVLTEAHLHTDGHSPAYERCVAAHQGQCGSCDEDGGFTPCS